MLRRLYISDLDGTLLGRDRNLPARTRQAIERFLARGGLFTVATGRSAASCAATLDGLKLLLPAITHNGALTTHLDTGAVSAVRAIPGTLAAALFAEAIARGLCPMAYALDEAGRTWLLHGERANASTARYLESLGRLHPLALDDGRRLRELRALSLILLDDPAALAELLEGSCGPDSGFTSSLGRSAYTPGLGVGEVQASSASKGEAARALAAELGLTEAEIVAFGDSCNDLPLLRLAGAAFCPGDAQAEVLAAVKGRIGCAADEGVAAYLEALLDAGDLDRVGQLS